VEENAKECDGIENDFPGFDIRLSRLELDVVSSGSNSDSKMSLITRSKYARLLSVFRYHDLMRQ
jgi:hypothetical protein